MSVSTGLFPRPRGSAESRENALQISGEIVNPLLLRERGQEFLFEVEIKR